MSFRIVHRSVDGAGLSRRDIPTLELAKTIADSFQRAADLDGLECSDCHGDGCHYCSFLGGFANPWRYEYVVFDDFGRRVYETRTLTHAIV